MRLRRRTLWLGCFLALAGCGHREHPAGKTVIAVIPKGTTHVFWQSVHAGAVKAATELGVDVHWLGPEKEDDRQQQIALVDNQVMKRVSGIVLAPLDAMALRRPVESAARRGVPVVIIDSDLKGSPDSYISFVATDNREGGRIAGRELVELLDRKGRVVLLRYMEGSASTENREAGFLEIVRQCPGIAVVSDEQHAGATAAQALQASENLLMRFKDPAGELTIDGIFCPNESSTYGMLQALRRQRLAGKVRFIGFDASPPLVEALRQGEIDGLVVQNPFRMGYLGVTVLCQHLQGQAVPKVIDTGVTLVTRANIDEPRIQELINPDLSKWLGK
ncbi:MAG: substrate-binding domain-containing protein [candidate division KSB1 bacterium]|nr:substrate-binding domain-containing protein [candidate division KSB1 bacterium]MDZ7394137.1 substrate-binding domain-containing protein [candidate division KSB1 bacterium]